MARPGGRFSVIAEGTIHDIQSCFDKLSGESHSECNSSPENLNPIPFACILNLYAPKISFTIHIEQNKAIAMPRVWETSFQAAPQRNQGLLKKPVKGEP